MNILLVCLFRGEKKKKNKVWLNLSEYFHQKNIFVFPSSNYKVTFNAHPKLIQKGLQEKLKQIKEKIIGN